MAYQLHHAPHRRRLSCGLLVSATILIAGCSMPLSDQVSLAAERTQQALTGYEQRSYHYPVTVPNSNRYVEIVTSEPLGFRPDYQNYLDWKAGKPLTPPHN